MIAKVINARILFTVLILGVMLIAFNEYMHPERWAWLTQPSIPGEKKEIKPLEQLVYYPGLDKEALKTVSDNSPWFCQDYKAWKNIIDILRSVPQSELNKYSFGRVPYVALKSDPKTFRGALINIRGNVHQCVQIKQKDNNDVDIPYIYQLTLSPDSSPSEPVIINTLDIPKGFPIGGEIEPQRIECTGFFFKNYAYATNTDSQIAPLILAKGFNWVEPIPKAKSNTQMSYWWALIIIIVSSILIFVFIQWRIASSVPPKPKKIPVGEFQFTPPMQSDAQPTQSDAQPTQSDAQQE